jgi:hypothetical protein
VGVTKKRIIPLRVNQREMREAPKMAVVDVPKNAFPRKKQYANGVAASLPVGRNKNI